tara:strand:- start:489 stop:695 length:207 start_codon:yes stop_codon:yes gene_type:complete
MKEKLELTDFTEEYNGFVSQLHSNINKLKEQLRESNKIIKQLRKELSIARQENGASNLWAELNDGRDS